MGVAEQAVALVIRSVPYQQRSARSQLDVALLAAALERPVQLYFLGAAVLQLLAERDLQAAALAPGYRAWASLPELTAVTVYAEPAWIDFAASHSLPLVLEPEPMDADAMGNAWRGCAAVMVL